MRVRLGYACISETLDVTSSSTYSYTQFEKEKNYSKLDQIIQSNFFALKEIILYNIKNQIHFYRMSSNIIPLATKKEVKFDYDERYQKEYQKIASLIKKANMRVDFHPNEYCVLNSVHEEVRKNSIEILKYHHILLKNLQIEPKILVLHIGSNVFGKDHSIVRFCHTYSLLEKDIQKEIAIENDDKIFTIDDCITIHKKIGVPIVFDYHHFLCNKGKLKLEEALKIVFASWKNQIPKIHFSSPKSKLKKEMRSHHDYIDSQQFILFLEQIKHLTPKVDIMIEAKKKDEAMFRLIRQLKYQTDYRFIDDTTFLVE